MNPLALSNIIARVAADWQDPDYAPRARAVEATLAVENRFTYESVSFAINQQVHQLLPDALTGWAGTVSVDRPLRIVVVNPGNIPFAELQDFLAVVLSGHRYDGKVSSRSPYLLSAFIEDLRVHGAEIDADVSEELPALQADDAIIASGSDATVEQLRMRAANAGMIQHRMLMRGHRFSVAVIGPGESADTMDLLAEDILLHDGLGCRNVALVWAPAGEPPDVLFHAMARFRAVFPAHPATTGSLKMEIAFYRASNLPHAFAEDGSFLVTKGDPELQRPGHLRWSEYGDIDSVHQWISKRRQRIELSVLTRRAASTLRLGDVMTVDPGYAQRPALGWAQDGTDVIDFLRSL